MIFGKKTKKEPIRTTRLKPQSTQKISLLSRLNPFRRNRKDVKKTVRPTNAAQLRKKAVNDITKQRLAEARKRKLKTIFERIDIRGLLSSNLLKIAVFLPILVGGTVLIINFRNSSSFSIKTITIIIDDQEKLSTAQEVLNKYKGSNIFTVDKNAIVGDLKAKIQDISQVFINKTIDGNLTVEIVRDVPTFYAVNLAGSYLLNQNGKVISILQNDKPINLTESDKIFLDGKTLEPNADLVRIKYLGKIADEEERKRVVWKDVSDDDKKQALEDLKNDFNSNLNNYFNSAEEILKKDDVLKLVGSYYRTRSKYNIGDTFDHDELNFLNKLFDFFKNKKIVIKRVVWTSDFTAQFELEAKPVVIFSMKRDLAEQTTDITTLIFYGQFDNQKIIDVRSSNYVIIH